MEIGRKIYYEKSTGNVLVDTGERSGDVKETTQEEDFATYTVLAERVSDSVGCLQLEYGQYALEFSMCGGYHLNLETLQIEFVYPDPNQPAPMPPLSDVDVLGMEHVKLDLTVLDLKRQLASLTDEVTKKSAEVAELTIQNQVLGSLLSSLNLQVLAIKGGTDASV